MKCPNCGGENSGKFCQFCGSEMPKESTPINITNNFFGSETNTTSQTSDGGCCPKCGSSKIGFKRERIGTNSRSTSRKKYVGTGRKGSYSSTASYRTVGLCQNCGYTWEPGTSSNFNLSSSKSNMVWWVLGWIFIFPLPLTIILLRKNNMNKWLRYGIIAFAWIVYIAWIASASSGKKKNTSSVGTPASTSSTIEISSVESTSSDASETITTPPSSVTEETIEVLYADDEKINFYVYRFNTYNPDYLLTTDDMKKYNHHGTEHDDQIRFFKDGFEIVITGGKLASKTSVYVGYTSGQSHTEDEYGEMFIRFAKVYAPALSDEKLAEYWKTALEGSSYVKFDEFEIYLSPGNVTYFKIEGIVE